MCDKIHFVMFSQCVVRPLAIVKYKRVAMGRSALLFVHRSLAMCYCPACLGVFLHGSMLVNANRIGKVVPLKNPHEFLGSSGFTTVKYSP